MELTEFCIRRPVFSTVLTLMIIVMGLVCQSRLPVRKDPKVEHSVITVESEFKGASPSVVEMQITKILEGSFATIPGAELITSNSANEKSEISVQFSPDRTSDGAAADLRDRLSLVRAQLPREIPEPVIRKTSTDSDAGIVLGFTSTRHTVDDLRDYVEKYIKSKFEALPGVGRVFVTGGNVKSVRVFLDPHRLAAYGYTPTDVIDAITYQHVQRPCGRLISKDREYMLIVNGELYKPEQFDEVVLPSNGKGKIVRIKDIGKTALVADDIREGSWFNGHECVAVSISKQSTANPIDLSAEIYKIMPEIRQMLPSGVEAQIAMDEADDINASMSNVYHAIFEATFLVIFVVFLFLWSFRSTIIPIVTIPVSLIGTFALLYMFDFSINTFTMLALVLAVGLVVDDAIVVLENVHRHMENGLTRFKAAIVGSKEIFFSIIAMTLTLATAYIPIAITPGTIGKFFKEFALTLSGAVLISGFVAVTLSPMMCSKLLTLSTKTTGNGVWARASKYQAKILNFFDRTYANSLKLALDNKLIVLSIGAALAFLGIITAAVMPSENFPKEDYGRISIRGNGPIGASYDFIKSNADEVEKVISKTPFVKNRYLHATTSEITGWITLQDWKDRNRSSKSIADEIYPKLRAITGVPCSAVASGSSGSGSDTVEFVLQTNQNYSYLERFGRRFLATLQMRYPGLKYPLRHSLLPPQQEYVIDINRDKAASLGVSVFDIVGNIEAFVRGRKATNVQRESKRDELFVQLRLDQRRTVEDLSNICVKSKLYTKNNEEPKMVPIADLITVRERQSPMALNHHNQMLSVLVYANLAEGHSLGQVIEDLTQLKEQILPDTIMLTFSGSTKSYLDDSRQIVFVFALALLFVFLVLAAQFESFIDPFVIMFSVPFSITGALLVLFLVPDGSLNIYSKVGLVTLIGLITKHGILIVDFANNLVEEGRAVVDAIKEAAHLRLRPILMTTFAMVIGAIPLALSVGAGAGARKQIGWAIVGGMTIGTLFTLFIVPIMYIFLSRFKNFTKKAD